MLKKTRHFDFVVTRLKDKVKYLISLSSVQEKLFLQLNLSPVTIHSGDMEIAIDRWLLIAE